MHRTFPISKDDNITNSLVLQSSYRFMCVLLSLALDESANLSQQFISCLLANAIGGCDIITRYVDEGSQDPKLMLFLVMNLDLFPCLDLRKDLMVNMTMWYHIPTGQRQCQLYIDPPKPSCTRSDTMGTFCAEI